MRHMAPTYSRESCPCGVDIVPSANRLGYPTVTTHSFRKTVATALDHSGLSAREIADYLGHENPSLTQDVYMAKSAGGTRAAKALDVMIVPKSKVRG